MCDPRSSLSFQRSASVMRISFIQSSPNTSLELAYASVIVVAMSWWPFQLPCTSGGVLDRRILSVKWCASWSVKYVFPNRGVHSFTHLLMTGSLSIFLRIAPNKPWAPLSPYSNKLCGENWLVSRNTFTKYLIQLCAFTEVLLSYHLSNIHLSHSFHKERRMRSLSLTRLLSIRHQQRAPQKHPSLLVHMLPSWPLIGTYVSTICRCKSRWFVVVYLPVEDKISYYPDSTF